MSEAIPSEEELLREFQDVAKQLDDVLKDIEWRKPDVENEERKLDELRDQAKKDPRVDVATQAIVVRVGREILNDKIAEAERLEARMKEIQAQLEAATTSTPGEREAGESGEAVHKTTEQVG